MAGSSARATRGKAAIETSDVAAPARSSRRSRDPSADASARVLETRGLEDLRCVDVADRSGRRCAIFDACGAVVDEEAEGFVAPAGPTREPLTPAVGIPFGGPSWHIFDFLALRNSLQILLRKNMEKVRKMLDFDLSKPSPNPSKSNQNQRPEKH